MLNFKIVVFTLTVVIVLLTAGEHAAAASGQECACQITMLIEKSTTFFRVEKSTTECATSDVGAIHHAKVAAKRGYMDHGWPTNGPCRLSLVESTTNPLG